MLCGSGVRIKYFHPDVFKNRSINQPTWLDHKTMKYSQNAKNADWMTSL